MYFLTIKLHFPLVCEIQHSVSPTPLICMILIFYYFQSSYSYLFLLFLLPWPPIFDLLLFYCICFLSTSLLFSFSSLPTGLGQIWLSGDFRAKRGSAGISDGMMWTDLLNATVLRGHCLAMSQPIIRRDMSFADALSFQVVCRKCLW